MSYELVERKSALIGRLSEVEKWRPVVGWEGQYEVSNLGRVRSVDRILPDGRRLKGKMMKTPRRHGYPMAQLCRNGVYKRKLVHSLVAEAFIGPRPRGMVVNHIDHIKWHAAVWNLEYVTYSTNIKLAHAFKPFTAGAKGRRELNPDKVKMIRQMLGTKSNGEIAREMGVSRGTINRIANGVAWKQVGC